MKKPDVWLGLFLPFSILGIIQNYYKQGCQWILEYPTMSYGNSIVRVYTHFYCAIAIYIYIYMHMKISLVNLYIDVLLYTF